MRKRSAAKIVLGEQAQLVSDAGSILEPYGAFFAACVTVSEPVGAGALVEQDAGAALTCGQIKDHLLLCPETIALSLHLHPGEGCHRLLIGKIERVVPTKIHAVCREDEL